MALSRRAAALVLAGVIVVILRPEPSTAWAWIALVLLLIGLDVLLAPAPRSLRWQRSPDEQVRLGESAGTTLTVTNPGGLRLRGQVRDAWPPSAAATPARQQLDLPAGESRRLTTTLRPTRRGDRHSAGVTVRSVGPLGVAARQRTVQVPGRIRALPPFHSRRHLPSRLAMLRQIDGRSAVRTRGQGTEFDSLRDYVDGDDVRSLDWRASARRQHLVVRTWQPERDRSVVLLLDTSRTTATRIGDVPRLDAAMDAALLLAALASRGGDRVQLIAGDREVRSRVAATTARTDLLHRMVEAMAPLEPALVEANWPALTAAVAETSRRRSLVVILTPLEPASIEEGLLPQLAVLSQRHRVVLASVSDPRLDELAADRADSDAVYDAAAAERTRAQKERTAQALDRLGVTVIDAPPDELPVALADHYLLLKRQGLL